MDEYGLMAPERTRIERVELADGCWMHVATDEDDVVVGTVSVAVRGAAARLSSLVVDAGHRREGIGTALGHEGGAGPGWVAGGGAGAGLSSRVVDAGPRREGIGTALVDAVADAAAAAGCA